MYENFQQPSSESKEQRLKRMLGFRIFPKRTPEEKLALLGSEERLRSLDAITTTTYPLSKKEIKKGAVLEITERNLLPVELLTEHPLVYIGSGTDIEYPLALGGRDIRMIDPILSDERAKAELIEKIRQLIKEDQKIGDGQKLGFLFDFGNGKEEVSVELVEKPYSPEDAEGYVIPDNVGLIVLYAAQSPGGRVAVDENMKSKLVEGGAILEETTIIKPGKNGEENIIELGE
ncbi:MAG: hypothetical protein WCO09_01530 [bacterium]